MSPATAPSRPDAAFSPWALALAVLALAAYALLSHWLILYAADRPWAVAALFGPFLVAVTVWALRRRHGPTLALCAAAVALLIVVVARGGVDGVNRLLVVQHVGMHLALGASFALTLRRGATALITVLAAKTHTHMTPGLALYTRGLTAMWVGYFMAMAALSLAIYAWAPWWFWSLLANVLTPLAVAALFIGEHALRYRLHPEFERTSIAQALRAYRQTPVTPPAQH